MTCTSLLSGWIKQIQKDCIDENRLVAEDPRPTSEVLYLSIVLGNKQYSIQENLH